MNCANMKAERKRFYWDEVRRAQLDAYYARLYGYVRDELRYILDPKEVHGEDFPRDIYLDLEYMF